MYSIMDSCPQECLEFKPELLHTLCVCSFDSPAHALFWINKLVPRNKNGDFCKWSSGRRARRTFKSRNEFVKNIVDNIESIDFKIYCLSATESDISHIAQYFYSQNLINIKQEYRDNKKSDLVFKITANNSIKMPTLRAARLIWAFECLHYLKSESNLSGTLHSDWFAHDSKETETPAEGVVFVNFLLSQLCDDLKISISKEPQDNTLELISDWFSGWCQSHMMNCNPFQTELEYITSTFKEKFIQLQMKAPYNRILYGKPCSFMEFNTTTNTLRIVFDLQIN